MTDFEVSTKFTGKDKVSSVLDGMGRKSDATASKMTRAFGAAKGGMSELKSTAISLGKPLAVLGVAAGFAEKKILETGAGFEEAISAVGAVGLQTRAQIAPLEEEARRLGASTKFTATEAANAMETMARAGFTNQQILDGVGGVLDAAAASGLEMAEVADHVSNALKGMGLEASEATRVSDVLTLASSKTNSSIGSLGESLSNVASTARQFNMPLEDTVAAVALLQDVGLDASVAGSALNTMLTKMAAPTDEVARQMKQFGVTFEDAEGNMLPFRDVLENISLAAKKSGGNMDQVAFLAELVGLRGQKAAANLKDLFDSGRTDELTSALYDAEGAAKAMAGLRLDNLKGDLTLLGSAVDGVATKLYDVQGGPLRGVVQGITAWLSDSDKIDKIVGKFEEFFDIAWELGEIFGDEFAETLGQVGEGMAAIFPEDDGDRKAWMLALKESAKNMGQLLAIATAVGVGVYSVAAGIMMLGSAVVSSIRGAWNGLIEFFGEKIFAVSDWIADIGAIFDAEGMSLGDKTFQIGKEVVLGLSKGMISMIKAPFEAMSKVAGGALDGAKAALGLGPDEAPSDSELKSLRDRRDDDPPKGDLGWDSPAAKAKAERFMRGGDGDGPSPMFGGFGGYHPSDSLGVTTATREELVRTQKSESEIVIRDETGRAQVVKPPDARSGTSLNLQQSGAP